MIDHSHNKIVVQTTSLFNLRRLETTAEYNPWNTAEYATAFQLSDWLYSVRNGTRVAMECTKATYKCPLATDDHDGNGYTLFNS